MKKSLRKGLRTWIEIDRKSIKHNYSVFRSLIPKTCKLMAVVKSNAYGHALTDFAKEMETLGADFFGVDSITEALALRRSGIRKPILVLGYTLPENISLAIQKNIALTVSSFETLSAIQKIKNAKQLAIHIKVDTGMGRHGFLLHEREKVLEKLKNLKNVAIQGLFTHFASAKDPHDRAYTQKQMENFSAWGKYFADAGLHPIVHASATSGTLLYPEAHLDMVRIGIGLYGVWPSDESKKFLEKKIILKPVLSWKTIIAEIKTLPKGSHIGYDGTEILKKDSRIAIIPVGYWHGLSRALSSLGTVLICGTSAKIIGRVCMDIIMIDVSDIKNSTVGDEIVIIGSSGGGKIGVTDIAKILRGSDYEILTRINPLIKRFYR